MPNNSSESNSLAAAFESQEYNETLSWLLSLRPDNNFVLPKDDRRDQLFAALGADSLVEYNKSSNLVVSERMMHAFAQAALVNQPTGTPLAMSLATFVASSEHCQSFLDALTKAREGRDNLDYPDFADLDLLRQMQHIGVPSDEGYIETCIALSPSTVDAIMMMAVLGHRDSGANHNFTQFATDLLEAAAAHGILPLDSDLVEEYISNGGVSAIDVVRFIVNDIRPDLVAEMVSGSPS